MTAMIRMRSSRELQCIIPQARALTPRRSMNRLATSAKQGACALMLVLSATAGAQDLSVKRVRMQVSRELKDSLTRILNASVQDRAFPGAYVIVGDSRGTLAKV